MAGRSEPAGHRRSSRLTTGRLRYRRRVFVRRFDDPLRFREAATPYLMRDEARHNLMLGICSTLVQEPQIYELFDLWLV